MFELANGVADVDELLTRLAGLIDSTRGRLTVDDWIGCLAINEPVFLSA